MMQNLNWALFGIAFPRKFFDEINCFSFACSVAGQAFS